MVSPTTEYSASPVKSIFEKELKKIIEFGDGTTAQLGDFLAYSTKANGFVWHWVYEYPELYRPDESLRRADRWVNKFTKLINPDAGGYTAQDSAQLQEAMGLDEGTTGTPPSEEDIEGWTDIDSQEWFSNLYGKIWNDPNFQQEIDIQNINEKAQWQAKVFEILITSFNHKDDLSESQKTDWNPQGQNYTLLDNPQRFIYNSVQSMRSFADQNKGSNSKYLKKENRSVININRLHSEGKIPVDIFDQINELPEDERSFQAQQVVIGSYVYDLNIINEMYPHGQPSQHYNGNYVTSIENFVKDIPDNDWNSNKGNAQLFPIPLTIEAQARQDENTNRLISDLIANPEKTIKEFVSTKPDARITADTSFIEAGAINNATDDLAKRLADEYRLLQDEGQSDIDAASTILQEANNIMDTRIEASYFGFRDGAKPFETQYLRKGFVKYLNENAVSIINNVIQSAGYLPSDISSDIKKIAQRELISGNITNMEQLGDYFNNVVDGNSLFDLGALKQQSEAYIQNDSLLTAVGKDLLGINPFMPSTVRDELEGQGKALAQLKEAIRMSLATNPYSNKTPDEIAKEILQDFGVSPTGELAAFPKLQGGVLQDDGTRIFDQHIQDAYDARKKALGTPEKITQIVQGQTGAAPAQPDAELFKQYDDVGNPGASLPAFRAIPVPVYEDQDVLQVIRNRYFDRPELVQFLQSQIPDIAQRFRLSQKPGALDQESFIRDVTDPETGEVTQEEYGLGAPTIDPETGENIYDISSSTAYSYFERDRPKSIADFIASEASQYEENFKQSRLFEEEQERLENERYAEDAKQRQRFVSTPLAIFGRRRR